MKALVDMLAKQEGAYTRLRSIIKHKYPNAKIVKTKTVTLGGCGVLIMYFEI
jgi:hypothetical protein